MTKKKAMILISSIAGPILIAAVVLFVLFVFRQPQGPVLICLDPGHGGSDPGAVHPDGRAEKDDNLALALAIRNRLLERSVDVILTREDDVTLSVEERCRFANQIEATHFLSLHRNSGGGIGIEAWVAVQPAKKEDRLGRAVLKALEACEIQRNRGLKTGSAADPTVDYRSNAYTDMTSCILELGFIDNDLDNELWDEHVLTYANAIADALARVR